MGAEGTALARRHERRLCVHVLVANYLGAGILIAYIVLMYRIIAEDTDVGRVVLELVVPVLAILAAASVSVVVLARRRIRPALAFHAEGRRPTAVERDAVYRLARRLAMLGSVHWIAAIVVLAAYLVAVDFEPPPGLLVRTIIASVMLAVPRSALSYLLVERGLRPVFASSVAADVERLPKALGLVARLHVAWLGTTGLPIAGIVLLLIGTTREQQLRAVPVVFAICAMSMLVAITVATFTGRTILEPVQRVRSALRSIEDGDLDVVLPVGETAELGDLELGLNRAAAALRARRTADGEPRGATLAPTTASEPRSI